MDKRSLYILFTIIKELARYTELQTQFENYHAAIMRSCHLPAETLDGFRLEGVAVRDEVRDGHVADDRAQRADEGVAGGVGDRLVRVGLAQEALGGGAHLLVGVADLDGGHGRDVDVDLVLVLGGDLEADRVLREGQVLDRLDDGQDEVAPAGPDDLDLAVAGGSGDQTGQVRGHDDHSGEHVQEDEHHQHDGGDDRVEHPFS